VDVQYLTAAEKLGQSVPCQRLTRQACDEDLIPAEMTECSENKLVR